MTTSIDNTYRPYLLPKRLVFFDLDGTIIPSTNAMGRRIAIAMNSYEKLRMVAKEKLAIEDLPDLDNEDCSQWHREHGGPKGLIKHVFRDVGLDDDVKECLAFYFNGLFSERLEQYHPDDLKFDVLSDSSLQFVQAIAKVATIILVSYRYQPKRDFYNSLDAIGLTKNGLFGTHNAFAVGGPSSSADGSKARFVGKMWRREIRAQRRLTSETGKTFPPFMIGDSIRDLHFAADAGGVFFGVSETGVDSKQALLNEIKELGVDLDTNSRVFPSIEDPELQNILLEECEAYIEALKHMPEES
jgi:phosphoglycolate phosphatase-like HAD superfamily hydrolase